MKTTKETLRIGETNTEYSRIPHMIYLDDFNTKHPSASRIDRIASEINEYLKYKRKNTDM